MARPKSVACVYISKKTLCSLNIQIFNIAIDNI